jgi:hypothetical protein
MKRPTAIGNYDLNGLINICEEYLDKIENDDSCDSDADHYIFEKAMETIYGPCAWDWLNSHLD